MSGSAGHVSRKTFSERFSRLWVTPPNLELLNQRARDVSPPWTFHTRSPRVIESVASQSQRRPRKTHKLHILLIKARTRTTSGGPARNDIEMPADLVLTTRRSSSWIVHGRLASAKLFVSLRCTETL